MSQSQLDSGTVSAAGVAAQRNQFPFRVTVLPLAQAELYVRPPEPTVQEQLQAQIAEKVAELKEEEAAQPEPAQPAPDVDKFAALIELQVQQELEKVRQRLQQEMGGKKK